MAYIGPWYKTLNSGATIRFKIEVAFQTPSETAAPHVIRDWVG